MILLAKGSHRYLYQLAWKTIGTLSAQSRRRAIRLNCVLNDVPYSFMRVSEGHAFFRKIVSQVCRSRKTSAAAAAIFSRFNDISGIRRIKAFSNFYCDRSIKNRFFILLVIFIIGEWLRFHQR